MAKRFNLHITDYQHIFRNKTKVFHSKAEIYTKGVLLSHIRNIEQISEDMGVDYFQMQHFITESNWDARMLMDQVSLKKTHRSDYR